MKASVWRLAFGAWRSAFAKSALARLEKQSP
jgi:hypothetical protein